LPVACCLLPVACCLLPVACCLFDLAVIGGFLAHQGYFYINQRMLQGAFGGKCQPVSGWWASSRSPKREKVAKIGKNACFWGIYRRILPTAA